MLIKWTAVEAHLRNENAPEASIKAYKSAVTANCNLSINERRKLASQYTSTPVFWSWDIPRTREGYYHFRNGAATAIKRSIEFAPYADLLWVETGDPSVETATKIARQIREAHPGKKLVYNLSPSFNWLGQGFSEEKLKSFVWDIAQEGYGFFIYLTQYFFCTNYVGSFVLQLISLAGLHSTATITSELSRRFATEGMLAYVNLIQSREKELGVDVLKHQAWSGAAYMDGIVGSILSGSSSSKSMGDGNTEDRELRGIFKCLRAQW